MYPLALTRDGLSILVFSSDPLHGVVRLQPNGCDGGRRNPSDPALHLGNSSGMGLSKSEPEPGREREKTGLNATIQVDLAG